MKELRASPINLAATPVRVADAMHEGIVACDLDASMRLVAQIMAEQRVHAVVVRDAGRALRPVGVIEAIDVAGAVSAGGDPVAFELMTPEVVTITADETLEQAARLMAEHDVGHVIVVDQAGDLPVGVLSSLDVARWYGR